MDIPNVVGKKVLIIQHDDRFDQAKLRKFYGTYQVVTKQVTSGIEENDDILFEGTDLYFRYTDGEWTWVTFKDYYNKLI